MIPKSPGFIRGECVNLTGKPADIVPELTATPNDPLVASTVDKFYNTDLGQNLADHQIKTVIITGTAANGAVLHTATGASFRGYEVIVPVDCMFANDLYAEQYTAWHMLNSPGTRRKASLSTADQITF